MTQIVGFIEKAALVDIERPDIADSRINTVHVQGETARAVLHSSLHFSYAGDMPSQRDHVAQKFDVLIGKANGCTCLISTCLLRSAPRINANCGCAEGVPDV